MSRADRRVAWCPPGTDGDEWVRMREPSLGDEAGAARELGELEDHELRGLHGSDPDLAHDLAGVDDIRGVRLVIALDEERLLGGVAEQGPLSPFADEER